jgi:HSP20 family protein
MATSHLHWPGGLPCTHWQPPLDVYRTDSGWVVKVDLAGVADADIAIELSGSRLTISGVRRDLLAEASWSPHSLEIAYSRFRRDVEIPCDLAQASLKREYRQGMLLVFLDTAAAPGDDRTGGRR